MQNLKYITWFDSYKFDWCSELNFSTYRKSFFDKTSGDAIYTTRLICKT